MTTDPNDLNMPFHKIQPVTLDEHALLSGGVHVLAVNVPMPDGGKHPAVMFRFAKPDGTGYHPPILLAPDRQADLRALPALVEQAVDYAIRGAAS